jgi:hypothetical protein
VDQTTTSEQPKEVVAPEDQAASTFHSMLPIWKRIRSTMSAKAKDRVMDAIIEWPLNEKIPKFQNKKEFELFKLGLTLLDCKSIMVSSVVQEKMKKNKEVSTEVSDELNNNQEQKENLNV